MHFYSVVSILLALTAWVAALPLPAPIPGRGPAAAAYTQLIINDIGNINTAVKKLTTKIDAYQGGVAEATPLFAGVLDIHLVNRKAFVDAIPPLSANNQESKKIVIFTENSVGQSIPASVQALESKKPELEKAGVTGLVVPGLKLLKHDHDSYSAELLQKVSPDYLERAKAVVAKIDNAIQGGIDDFSK